MYRAGSTAILLTLVLGLGMGPTTEAQAAKRPPLPRRVLPSDRLYPPGVEEQASGNYVRVPDRRDRIAISTGLKYCKAGPHNFAYAGGVGGRSFSATLDVNRFCHRGRQVSEISVSPDHRLYGVYNFYMKFDHSAITKGYYNYRGWGNYSGYYVRAKYYFLYCYEPSRNLCSTTYIVYLRTFVHADGTSTTFQSIPALE